MLIIAGQPKAGTTSLFDWLSVHPDVCPSQLKEARFFLDRDYPLQRPRTFDGSNIEPYRELFPCWENKVLLDATPDAMYSDVLVDVAALLPEARVVIVVRDPLERMVSAFGFLQQRGLLPSKLSFDDWVERQVGLDVAADTPVQWRALDHCRLHKYLPRLEAAWGSRLLVIGFDELVKQPAQMVARICRHAGLREFSGDAPSMSASNRTVTARWPRLGRLYHSARRYLASAALRYPGVRARLRPVSRRVNALLYTRRTVEKPEPKATTVALIQDAAAGWNDTRG